MKRKLNFSIGRWAKNEDGSTSILFAGALVATVLSMGAAIDYSNAATARTRLQAATDSALLGVAHQAGIDGSASANNVAAYKTLAQQYVTANGPSGSTVAEFHACFATGGDCTTKGGQTLKVGADYLQTTDAVARLFGGVTALSSSPTMQVNAMTAGNAALWPQNLTFNMVGAKGWYYKTVTLYVLPWSNGVASTSYTPLATWTYQPINLGTPTGSYNFTLGTDTANGMTNIHASNLGSGYGTLTGPSSVTLGQYADFFLVMNVMQGPCGPSTPWMPSNWSGNTYSFPASCFAANPNPTNKSGQTTYVQNAVGYTVCTESESNSGGNPAYASYNAICNPNTGANASYNSSGTNTWQFMFVGFSPQQQNSNLNGYSNNVPLTTMFPCGSTATHQWEDGGSIIGTSYATALSAAKKSGAYPSQDLFYTVNTVCTANAGMSGSSYQSSGSVASGNILTQ